jgi:hypothetical protein
MEYEVARGTQISTPYPPDTKAFLYHSIPPEKPRNVDIPLTKHQTHMQRGLQLLWDA